jgi:hypothetical protein
MKEWMRGKINQISVVKIKKIKIVYFFDTSFMHFSLHYVILDCSD